MKELYETFSSSEYGKTLEGNIRFGDFKPEYIANEVWEALLGDDVNNLRHMLDTYRITRRFMRFGGMDDDLLKLTAITHDWGEAVVGDVALPDKNRLGVDTQEVEAYKRIASELGYSALLEEVPEVIWGQHELSEPFRVIEYIGYCRTGMRAGLAADAIAHSWVKLDIPRTQREGLIGGLLSLNKAVSVYNYKVLAGYIDKYPHIPKVML